MDDWRERYRFLAEMLDKAFGQIGALEARVERLEVRATMQRGMIDLLQRGSNPPSSDGLPPDAIRR